MSVDRKDVADFWRITPVLWGLLIGSIGLLVLGTLDGWQKMIKDWNALEAYSYGYLVPAIVLFLLWQRKDRMERLEFSGSWTGLLILGFGIVIAAVGKLTTITTLIQYGFVFCVIGVACSLAGITAFRKIAVPLALLFFMLPLPQFFYANLSAKLQLLSSWLGVSFARLLGVSVYLEGNVIDLGSYQLQVVEACSGLNYLFPLLTLAFLVTYFYSAPLWARAIVFLSSIPITILMNSFRIGVISLLVEYWGSEQAEGFLHFFEGWVIFMACLAILIGEIWLITRLTGDKRPWAEIFGIEMPAPTPKDASVRERRIPAPFIAAMLMVGAFAAGAQAFSERRDIVPVRSEFARFPTTVGEWSGRASELEQVYLDSLKLDDYLLGDYVGPGKNVVNLYSAYYATQRADQSAHSPRTCLPGGGWVVRDFGQRSLDGVTGPQGPLTVNRSVIQKGEYRQVVYYWFQQRGRNITNEYAAKWYLLVDGLTRHRTDGALIRLTTPVAPTEDAAAGDARLTSFARTVLPLLPDYIPN